MTHANRSTRDYQFIAYSMVTLHSLACGSTPRAAIEKALEGNRLGDASYIECLDCGSSGRKVWNDEILLPAARRLNKTVFRGSGFSQTDDHLQSVALAE